MEELKNIQNYEIIGLLGEGGVSKVFKAKKQGAFGFSKTFAIKLLHSHANEKHSHFTLSFVAEAKMLSFLSHPNIVQVYELGQLDDGVFVVMDFIEGVTLEHLLKTTHSCIPYEVSLSIVYDILNALCFMQSIDLPAKKISIIHGDISLQNIMIQSKTGLAKLNDFGFSRAVDYKKSARLQPPVIGNPYYISPEHMRGEWIDQRSDIYSLGIVLYDLLFNERSFHYDLHEIKNLAKRGQTINRDNFLKLPSEILNIISKMTALNPIDRYQDPEDPLNDIENYFAKIQEINSIRRLKFQFMADNKI